MTIYEVKQKAVDALGAVDTSKLTLMDLGSYANILSLLYNIKEPDPTFADSMKDLTEKMALGFNTPKQPVIGDLS